MLSSGSDSVLCSKYCDKAVPGHGYKKVEDSSNKYGQSNSTPCVLV